LGRPYDAREQLGDEFGDIVSEELIEQVAAYVERDGVLDWAPGSDHPDHERAAAEYRDGVEAAGDLDGSTLASRLASIEARLVEGTPAHFGDGWEREERNRILERLARLEAALDRPKQQPIGIGHNNPPQEGPEVEEIRATTFSAGTTLRTELAKERPSLISVAKATAGLLKSAGSWFLKKADIAADAFVRSAGTAAGPIAVAELAPPIQQLILDLCNAAINWLDGPNLPF
jgi:hypothetical protein